MLYRLIRFCVVGFSGVFVDFAITYIGKELLRLNKYVANAMGFLVACSSNYLLNRLWTFGSTNPEWELEYLKFFAFSLVGLLLNTAILYLLHNKLRLHFYLSKLLAIGAVTLWNFFANYFFTFTS